MGVGQRVLVVDLHASHALLWTSDSTSAAPAAAIPSTQSFRSACCKADGAPPAPPHLRRGGRQDALVKLVLQPR